ncbi:hypothetical protein ZTR_10626 [Talaromyces verruculosus]|nr:hypothetical protein ZTR_10626 [Talaromyces verruculosus]
MSVAANTDFNCVLTPEPPVGAASVSVLNNKVIGYYEAWMARKDCHKVTPTDLPLDALTHINFAFAYIDPDSYQIVTMDSDTPSSLFQDITNVKSIKSDIEVFVTVGGWTFSDNGTATQPLFGEIAADAAKRREFADNVVHFLKQYGFDGLDIDWEYPGASDRRGSPEDTANYVLLLQTLRQTFDASGSKFGLTFTAPSSYWYLSWFDLPSMIKYADWINMMTYDLHGVWDSTNPIGSIVQAHTNLTEIKLAAELFWRVNIPPEKLVMGFGFYGRSFTLADTSCTKPGCPFKGAPSPGPCSGTGGFLAYYEIMDVLNSASASSKRSTTITPVHDTTDAVNYFTFDDDQWVSYDDATTFSQKVAWANEGGLGGVMIWASDLDDDKYSAHAGLTNKTIMSTPTLQSVDLALSNPQSVIQNLASFNGQNCFTYLGHCVNLNDNDAMAQACGSGYTVVGWDDAGCGTHKCHCGKPVCCPTSSAPKNCMWRGDSTVKSGTSSDCSAQCNQGEINIAGIKSNWGGGFVNDGNTDKCGRGDKVFCCPDPEYNEVIEGCAYADCGSDCPSGSKEMFVKLDTCWGKGQKYCCTTPADLADCHWVSGKSGNDCAQAVCAPTELAIDQASYGDSHSSCDWERKKVACCTVKKAAREPAICGADMCALFPGYCPDEDSDDTTDNYTKRSVLRVFDKRGSARTYTVEFGELLIKYTAPGYPSIGSLFSSANSAQVLRWAYRLNQNYCSSNGMSVSSLPAGAVAKALYAGLNAEHIIDKQIMERFILATLTGYLQSKKIPNLLPVSDVFWTTVWHSANAALGAFPPVGSANGASPATPNDRIMEALGSYKNMAPLLATASGINAVKGRLMGFIVPFKLEKLEALAIAAVAADSDVTVNKMLTAIRNVFATFEYFRDYRVVAQWNSVLQQVGLQWAHVEQATGVTDLQNWWWAWAPDYFNEVEKYGQKWCIEAVRIASGVYAQARADGKSLKTNDMVVAVLSEFNSKIQLLKMPTINADKTIITD